ncbi:hypothetical protein TCAL_16987 [Tigriopus californicus]|uniref:Uncharacterized protein n=1 Tax=Tigriopus californicus TaxID=6832 RepID=A0A553PIF2_TIGCA|nr:hypothetical protein TCAL_16987 [Tigriopus californicus]
MSNCKVLNGGGSNNAQSYTLNGRSVESLILQRILVSYLTENLAIKTQFNSIVNEMKQAVQDSSKEKTEAIIRSQADMLSKLGDILAAKLTPPQPPAMSPSVGLPSLTLPVTQPMSNGGMPVEQVSLHPLTFWLILIPWDILLEDASSGLTAHDPAYNMEDLEEHRKRGNLTHKPLDKRYSLIQVSHFSKLRRLNRICQYPPLE